MRSRTELLPTFRQKRYARQFDSSFARTEPHARSRSARAMLLLAMASIAFVATPAHAFHEPILLSTFPAPGRLVRSTALEAVLATYDRDLDPHHSRIRLFDAAGVEVPGGSDLSGPNSDTGGKRTIRFVPDAPLSETGTPYLARAVARTIPTGRTDSEWAFGIDDTAPADPAIDSPVPGEVRTDQPLVVQGDTEPGAHVHVLESLEVIATGQANSLGRFWIPLPYPAEDGVTHTIAGVAVDQAGNASGQGASVTFVHDSVVRLPAIVTPREGESLPSAGVVVSGDAKPGTDVTVHEGTTAVGTTTADQNGFWSVTISFSAGHHTITATSFDGTTTDGPSQARHFIVDLTGPAPPVIATPAAGAILDHADVTVSGTAEPRTSVRVRQSGVLRGTVAVDEAGGWSAVISFTEGTHTIAAEGVDAAGNTSVASSRTFTVDTVPPASPAITTPAESAFVTASPVTIAGTAEPGTTLVLEDVRFVVATTTASATGAWSASVALADGTHSIEATARDAAGNASPRSRPRTFTLDTLPPPAPLIDRPEAGQVFDTRLLSVAGTAEPGATVAVIEGTTVATASVSSAGLWQTTATFGHGTHTITARATDIAGNLGPASAPRTFSVNSPDDSTAPPTPVIQRPTEGEVVPGFVTIAGSAEPGATVRVTEGVVLGTSTADGAGAWAFGVTLVSGPHVIHATAFDAAGNVSAPTAARKFTVDAARPEVTIETPPSRVIFLPGEQVVLSGRASDDIGVARVELEIHDLVTGRRVATLVAACDFGCGSTAMGWTARPALPPGAYRADAYAVDLVANRSRPASATFYRL